MADALAKATRAYFDYQSNWEVEGRDLVFVEVDFINDMSAETGDSYSTAVGGLEIARLALMNWGCTIIAESGLYTDAGSTATAAKSYLLSGPAGLADSAFEDHTVTTSLEAALRAAYTAAAAAIRTTANWGSCAVNVYSNFGPAA